MAAHVAPSTLALSTKRERLPSTCVPAAAIRGRLASTPSRSRSSSQDVEPWGQRRWIADDLTPQINTFVADVDTRTSDQLGDLGVRLQTERTMHSPGPR